MELLAFALHRAKPRQPSRPNRSVALAATGCQTPPKRTQEPPPPCSGPTDCARSCSALAAVGRARPDGRQTTMKKCDAPSSRHRT